MGVAVSGFGDTPDPRSTTDEIASYFVSHRTDVLVGVVLLGVALIAMLVVINGLAGDLHLRGRETSAGVVQSSATVAVGIIAAGMLLPYSGLSYIIGAEAPDSAKSVFALTILATPVCALPLAACLGGLAIELGRERLASRWFVWTTGVVAVAMAATACSFAASGALSPDVQQQVLFQLLIVWLILSGFGARSSRLRARQMVGSAR